MKNIFFLKTSSLFVCIISVCVIFISCDDIVDVDPPNNQINQKDVFKDIATTKSALSMLYSKVRDTPLFSRGNPGLNHSLSLYTDQLEFIGTKPNMYYLNTLEASSHEITQWWNNTYFDIYAINNFINGLNESSYIKQADKTQLLAEAYTLRALYYQTLVQLFGDIPYTVSTDYKYNTTIGKTSYQEVLLLIEKDLLLAYQNLDYTSRSNQRFYINKTVAELLLSYNYLLQKQYDKAELYSKAIIDNSNYSLEDDLNKVFKKDAKSTLWQLSPNLNTAVTQEANLYQIKTIGVNTVAADNNLLKLFAANDLRYKNWLQKATINNRELHQIFKYKNTANNTDEVSIFYRVEEAYFNLSLALALQNKTDKATSILNQIRQKRGLNSLNTSMDQTSFIKEYLDESSREFFTENGRRFFDLKLTNRLGDLNKNKPNWKDNHNLFPIPERQLQINKNLLPQNAGY
ncbi:RagB/SusD family nutrient uptake outer membrane protein [Myroides sp. M-43]|uniref:RagB/SusD family nutrient uptake outer membrane protein n=1 Tax=Myroides oncorhynchi TaxID=2893756 RepID=UPI001E5BD956|nr:RagB/SusD family nutrient uptake outer membrane protein [Myroides oncorhynchi]MCC9043582.1 RagB/SusD family nutrient uptake outer membrane protein [Myroides oncorhynchi]